MITPPSFTDALRGSTSVRAVELRPPPATLDPGAALEAWIDFELGVRRLLAAGHPILLTDDAVGEPEEESLRVLTTHLGSSGALARVVPFLTLRHSLEYCLLFARRAHSGGFGGVTVTGGDESSGVPRCLPRSRDLRARIRERFPDLALGAWVNPFRDPVEQVELLMDPEHHADYYLTQVVSHHDTGPIAAFLAEARRQGLELPGMVGVFHYRSARRATLERLRAFLPVPVEAVMADFDAGLRPDEIGAATARALLELGIENLYWCNLGVRDAARRIERIEGHMDCTSGAERP